MSSTAQSNPLARFLNQQPPTWCSFACNLKKLEIVKNLRQYMDQGFDG